MADTDFYGTIKTPLSDIPKKNSDIQQRHGLVSEATVISSRLEKSKCTAVVPNSSKYPIPVVTVHPVSIQSDELKFTMISEQREGGMPFVGPCGDSFFVLRNKKAIGPYTRTLLHDMLENGIISRHELIVTKDNPVPVPVAKVVSMRAPHEKKEINFALETVDPTLEIREIYLYRHGKRCGPFTLQQLQTLIKSRMIASDDMVVYKGCMEAMPCTDLITAVNCAIGSGAVNTGEKRTLKSETTAGFKRVLSAIGLLIGFLLIGGGIWSGVRVGKNARIPLMEQTVSVKHRANVGIAYCGEDARELASEIWRHYVSSASVSAPVFQQAQQVKTTVLSAVAEGKTYTCTLSPAGTKNGSGHITIAMTPVTASAAESSYSSDAPERILAYEAIFPIVNNTNPMEIIPTSLIYRHCTGSVNRRDGSRHEPYEPQSVYICPSPYSGLGLLNDFFGGGLSSIGYAVSGNERLIEAVSCDIRGLGLIRDNHSPGVKYLAVGDGDRVYSYPTDFSIFTEEYPLSRRITVRMQRQLGPVEREFAAYMESEACKTLLKRLGYKSPRLLLDYPTLAGPFPAEYRTLVNTAARISVNAYFLPHSFTLHNYSRDLLRDVAEYLHRADKTASNILCVGFSEYSESQAVAMRNSVECAASVQRYFKERGIMAVACGFGAAAPIKNPPDNSRNRRVELWIEE